MTRSLGDQLAKSIGVTWKPDIIQYQMSEADKILVLGSDGVWEFIENKDVIKHLIPYYLSKQLEEACDSLLEVSKNLCTHLCSCFCGSGNETLLL